MKDLLILIAHLLTAIAKLPGPGVARAIVDTKRRNATFGCPRIAHQINLAFGITMDKDLVRRNAELPGVGEDRQLNSLMAGQAA